MPKSQDQWLDCTHQFIYNACNTVTHRITLDTSLKGTHDTPTTFSSAFYFRFWRVELLNKRLDVPLGLRFAKILTLQGFMVNSADMLCRKFPDLVCEHTHKQKLSQSKPLPSSQSVNFIYEYNRWFVYLQRKVTHLSSSEPISHRSIPNKTLVLHLQKLRENEASQSTISNVKQ